MDKMMIEALEKRYEAIISESYAIISIYLKQAVGIGEHPQHLDEIDKLVGRICEAEHKIEVIQNLKI